MSDYISISVRQPGREPIELTDVKGFVLIPIPARNEETDTPALFAGMSIHNLAECGVWLLRLARSMQSGKPAPPLGRARNQGSVRSKSGLILPPSALR